MIKSEKITEVVPFEPKSYKELELLYNNLKEEYEKLLDELTGQEKKNRGLEKTIRKLKDQNTTLRRNIDKTVKAWRKEVNTLKSQLDTQNDTESVTKVDKSENRKKYPWMAVGC